ncbi:hypothetical protein KGF54_004843 [Candida jiufengensis]|uniref:uncharacterized protein n=1 Tax=Candida jiufengensis TaxID=497108 RepID=UPI0022257B60|nr:uncharacterized protein KGF54_004843 [Candida jiufengensis]KAI5951768.1 hypothetical protein KGF54_004843 [Candida jiufengensis]
MFNLLNLLFGLLTSLIPIIYTIKSLDKSLEFNKYSYQFLLNYWLYYIILDYITYTFFNNLGIINFGNHLIKIWLFFGSTKYESIEINNIVLINHILFKKFYKNYHNFENYFNFTINKISPKFNKIGDLNYRLNQFGINYSQSIDSNYSINFELILLQIINFIKLINNFFGNDKIHSIDSPNSNSYSKKLKKIRKQSSFTSFTSVGSRSNSSSKSTNSNSSDILLPPAQQHQQQQKSQYQSPKSIFSTNSPQPNNDEINLMTIPKYRISSTPPPIADINNNIPYPAISTIPNSKGFIKRRSKSNGDYDLDSSILKFRQHQAHSQSPGKVQIQSPTQSPLQTHSYKNDNIDYQLSPTQPTFIQHQHLQPLQQQYYQQQQSQHQQQQHQPRVKSNTSSRNTSGSNYNYEPQLNRSENYRQFNHHNNNHHNTNNNRINNREYRDYNGGYKVNSNAMRSVSEQLKNSNNNNELPAVPTPSMVLQ